MVRAILDGSKTQTRRITRLQPDKFYTDGSTGGLDDQGDWVWWRGYMPMAALKNKYGTPGDLLWVRETYYKSPLDKGPDFCGFYRASDSERKVKWKPSILMPRRASRITLKIVSVGVERLNDISGKDAEAEGVNFCNVLFSTVNRPDKAKALYKSLWESINGAGSWDKNPWVWRIEFRRVKP